MSDTYYLQPPKEQKFYYVLSMLSAFMGMSQEVWWGFDPSTYKKIFLLNKILVSVFAPFLLVSQIIYFVINYSNLTSNVKGIMFAVVPVTGFITIILFAVKQKSFKKVMKDYTRKIHLCNLEFQDEFVRKKRIQIEKITRYVSYFTVGFLMMDWLAWCTITSFNNYRYREQIQNKTKRLETIIYPFLPFDYEYDYRNWLIVHTCNVYLVWGGCVIVSFHLSINFVFIFQLIGHIEILKHRIETEFENSFTQEEIRDKLIQMIQYHIFVLCAFGDIQDALGLSVTAYYFYNLLADSLNLYQLIMGEKSSAILYGLMVIVYVGVLIIMSFVLEEIRRQSEGLSDAVYNLDWQNMSFSNRKILLLFLMKIQPAMQFTALGGLKAGVKPMISIGRTSFSIYVMLKSNMRT